MTRSDNGQISIPLSYNHSWDTNLLLCSRFCSCMPSSLCPTTSMQLWYYVEMDPPSTPTPIEIHDNRVEERMRVRYWIEYHKYIHKIQTPPSNRPITRPRNLNTLLILHDLTSTVFKSQKADISHCKICPPRPNTCSLQYVKFKIHVQSSTKLFRSMQRQMAT